MKLYQVSDQQKAACEKCKAFVNATFKLRDVDLSDKSSTVKNVLVAVCDSCNEVILLPHQSSDLVKETIDKSKLTEA
tara:strand:- start:14410 stop:14640 length:231 start_codon:yes stop_codon:yes gene_type:complete